MDVLLQLEHWLKDEQGHQVLWLSGLAGTGKSTIAKTFAEISFADGILGASFFCSRDSEARSNLKSILPTLAFQLAYRYTKFRERLLQVLSPDTNIKRESLYTQMEKVIVGPFRGTQIQTLIIIDALDECKDDEPASAILSVLSRFVGEIPQVRFLITGRPEYQISSGFRLKPLRPITDILKLHDVKPSLVDGDIRLFFKAQLTNIAETWNDCDLPKDWPSSNDIDVLCKKAAGLFIYASTVVKFIISKYHTLSERLALITSLPESTTHEGKSGIDLLYTQVLEQAFCNVGSDGQELYSRFRSVVGAVVLVFNPLSIKVLSTLLETSNISTTLRSLHSLLLIPDSAEDPIRTFHKSFHDFLTDPSRCEDKRFFVDPSVQHIELVLSCLNLMKKRLKRNICNLDDHAILSGVGDLSTHQKTCIGSALEYACCFWTRHLIETPCDGHNTEIQKAVDEFFITHLLFWIEVLAIIGNLNVGVYAINDIRQWYISVSHRVYLLNYVFIIYSGRPDLQVGR